MEIAGAFSPPLSAAVHLVQASESAPCARADVSSPPHQIDRRHRLRGHQGGHRGTRRLGSRLLVNVGIVAAVEGEENLTKPDMAAGFKRNRHNAARLNTNEHIQARVAFLQSQAAERGTGA